MGPVDFILISATSLKSLSTFHRTAASVIAPNHTVILVDSTGYVELHSLIEARFPNNPVCAISLQTVLRSFPTGETSTLDEMPLLIHSGHVAKAFISPASNYTSRLESLAHSLRSAGVDAIVDPNYKKTQWDQVIPMLAFQPLSVMLETKTPQALVSNILSKPLYSGIIGELMTVASTDSGYQFGPDYVDQLISEFQTSSSSLLAVPANGGLTPSPTSSTSSTSSLTYSNTIQHLDAPHLFYDFYHSLPIHVDLLLLQPILVADNHGIKTPYLESMFAFMSQLVGYNANTSSFFTRKNCVQAAQPTSAPVDNKAARELDERERQLRLREKMVAEKEQKLGQWSNSLQRMQQNVQQRGSLPPPQGPPPPQTPHRPHSAMPAPSRVGSASNMKDSDMMIDMMHLTNRRNRRGANPLRSSNSTASLANLAASQDNSQYRASPAGVSRASNRAQSNDGSTLDFGSITDNRYGAVDSSKLNKSRSNSLTMDSILLQQRPKPGSSPALFSSHFLPHLEEEDSLSGKGQQPLTYQQPQQQQQQQQSQQQQPNGYPAIPPRLVRPAFTPSPPSAVAPTANAYQDEAVNPYQFSTNPYAVSNGAME